MHKSTIIVNRTPVPLSGEHRLALADFIRDSGTHSVHLGCEHGVCGGCNVLLDGDCTRSCLMLAHACEGSKVLTMEGLIDPLAERLRAAFNAHHALQCGFCTPGMFVSAYDLLRNGNPLTEDIVRERIAGNICRCTGYQGIVDAILSVAANPPSDPTAAEAFSVGDPHV